MKLDGDWALEEGWSFGEMTADSADQLGTATIDSDWIIVATISRTMRGFLLRRRRRYYGGLLAESDGRQTRGASVAFRGLRTASGALDGFWRGDTTRISSCKLRPCFLSLVRTTFAIKQRCKAEGLNTDDSLLATFFVELCTIV